MDPKQLKSYTILVSVSLSLLYFPERSLILSMDKQQYILNFNKQINETKIFIIFLLKVTTIQHPIKKTKKTQQQENILTRLIQSKLTMYKKGFNKYQKTILIKQSYYIQYIVNYMQEKRFRFTTFILCFSLIQQLAYSICTGAKYWNPLNNACVDQCPWNYPNLYYADPSTHMCVTVCPTTPSYYADDYTQTCTQTCPWNASDINNQTYYDDVYRKCTLECPANPSRYKSYSNTTRTCVQYCQPNYYALDTNRSCVSTCPNYYFINRTLSFTQYRCVAQCPNNTFIDTSNKQCVKAINCPALTYGNPLNGQCVQNCPSIGSIQLYADTNPNVKMCVYVCPNGYYMQNQTNDTTCVTNCSAYADRFIDFVQMKCVSSCPNGTYSYLPNATCLSKCPFGLFGDPFLKKCASGCTSNYFSDSTTNMCVPVCPYGYFGDVTASRVCKLVCSVLSEYGNPLTRLCVNQSNCPSPYIYADNYSRQCVTQCPQSQNTYGDTSTNACVLTCPWNSTNNLYTYIDSSTQRCVTQCPINPSTYRYNITPARCMTSCPSPYFAVQANRSCELACPANFYEDQVTRKCISKCPQDPVSTYYFSNSTSNYCLQICPGVTLADPTTMSCISTRCPSDPALYGFNNTCIGICPSGYFQNQSSRTCQLSCVPLNQDNSTRRCVAICPTNPNLFAYNNTCILRCPPGWFSDDSSRTCTQTCNQTVGYLAYTPTRQCVLACLNNTYSYNGTCVDICPNASTPVYYIDKTTISCVTSCPDYYFRDNMLGECVLADGCTSGYYADYSARLCVLLCNSTLYLYRDDSIMQCVDQCPFNLYGDPSNSSEKICRISCPSGWFQDNSTWTCVQTCPTYPSYYADLHLGKCVDKCRIQLNQYAFDDNRTCVTQCSNGTFADNYTRRCLIDCLRIPSTYQYVNGTQRICVLECPIGYFSDNSTRSCVTDCPNNPNYFAHWESRTCVTLCPQTPTTKYYADNYTRTCVEDCPTAINGTYRDPILRICMPVCSDEQFADNSTGDCVTVCPSDPDMFGQINIKKCVYVCDHLLDLWADNSTRTCVNKCPNGTYSDNFTQRCVSICPASQLYYGDPSTNRCVLRCPIYPQLFADNMTQQCVHICPNQTYGTPVSRVCQQPQDCPPDYWADPFTKLCVTNCPPTQQTYANNFTHRCDKECPIGRFADNSTYRCVSVCPSTPSYFGYNLKCVKACPNNTYADNWTRLCLPSLQCNNVTYGDPTTQTCVSVCPFNYYADVRNTSLLCVQVCPEGWYADDLTKQCVVKCPLSNKTYGSNSTNKCVQVCPIGEFAENVTRMCMLNCPSGSFADYNVRVCVASCSATPNLYGQDVNNTCVQTCPEIPDYYADNSTRLCKPNCPFSQSTFADRLTRRCVLTCPVSGFTYADNITRRCQPICYHNGSYNTYADNSTGRCVTQCPSIPDYYADNSTWTCVPFCPNSTVPRTFTDNTNRRCVPICNWTTYYYSDNTTGDCLTVCPGGYFADNQSQSCVKRCAGLDAFYNFGYEGDKICKNFCPLGWFAQNSSRLCTSYCPINQYADSTKRRCVSHCDGMLREYADNSTNRCVPSCPPTPDMFADNISYTCVLDCPPDFWNSNATRQCVQNCTPMYADNYTGRCVQFCPKNLYTYADNVTYRCVAQCPNETVVVPGTFADDSTKTCVVTCPIAPWTYAQNITRICVYRCPNGTFGQNSTRQCVANCSRWTAWGDNSTSFCVANCPANSFADNRTFLCVEKCPGGTFADNSTWRCVVLCPSNPALYGDLNTSVCVINCQNDFYGDDLSRTCKASCPTNPRYYAYQPTKRCYKDCLYPYFGEYDIGKCVLSCYWGQYRNMTTHRCTACPIHCTSCVSELGCQTCVTNYFLFNGTCLAGCSNLYPTTCISECPYNYLTGLITYASPVSLSCVQTCPTSYYGLNSTLWCIQSCPINYFPSDITRRCQLCINGCNNCTNATYCFSCYSGYLYSNNLCIRQCSITLPYYYGSSCLIACIDGTYLMTDQVTCNNCSSLCATCSLTASNCTRCVGAFLYNYNCVNKCPTNYYANSNLVCVPCTSSAPECNVQPLTYTLNTFTNNGALYGVLTFNRQVFMDTSNIKNILNITLNGIPSSKYNWTATRINGTSYNITINSQVSLNQMTLSLIFLNPNLVIDSQGTIITDTTITAPLPTYDYISPEVKSSTMGITTFSGAISYLALAILLVLLFKGAYPLLLVFEVFQMIYFHYFVIQQLPYNFSNFLLNIKYLNFQFLPSLFSLMIPSTFASSATPQKFKLAITDTTFFISSGHYFLVIGFYVLWALVITLLKNKQINRFTKLRRFAKNTYENRIRFGCVNECVWYCFMTFTLFGLWQIYDTSFPYTWNYANFAVAILCLVLCFGMVVWVVYLTLSYRNKFQILPKKFNFILGEDSFLPYQMPLRYIRKLLFCLFLFTGMIQLQIVGMIASNFIILSFYVIYRPSKYRFNNYVNILIQLCYIGIQLTIIFFANDFSMTTDQKLEYGTAMVAFSAVALITVVIWLIWQFLMFLYDFKFIRDIIQETKIANQIHPEQDNLKVQFQKDYKKDQLISHISGLQNSEENDQRDFQDETIVGIQKQYDAVVHYDQKTVNKQDKNKKNKKQNDKFKKKDQNLSDQKSSQNQPRLISSRNSSRMLFADINIEDIE